MKRSDMKMAETLLKEVDRLDGMRDDLEKYPPMTAYLNINGASFQVALTIAQTIIGKERERALSALKDIGMDPYS